KKFFAAVIACLIAGTAHADIDPEKILESMTLNEKIGQLFIIRPDQLDTRLTLEDIHNDKKNAVGVKNLNPVMLDNLKKFPAGGFAIFRKNLESPSQIKKFNQALKDSSKIFPFIAIDEEGGQIARIANNNAFNVPKFKSSAEIAKTGQTLKASLIIGKYLKEYGFNYNFAPVADVNTNPQNIVIGDRAFGNDPDFAAKNVSEYLDGLHAHCIAGSIKHFPGHGDTTNDTHAGQVIIYKTWPELLKCEIIPFKANLNKADSVMTAHINLPNVTRENLPASLSHELITGKLRNELKYNGVIITDALMMGAIKDNYSSENAAVMAIKAGCDILLMPYDYIAAFEGVVKAVKSGQISEERINQSVRRILIMKHNLQEPKWWQKSAVYQIYPKSFADSDSSGTGDINGITSKLDYLQELGIKSIWITPVYESPMIDNGYDVANYTGIDKTFGTMADFDNLLSQAKKRDIKIVMDLVYNHTSDQHKWFIESKSSKNNPKSDWYIWRDAKEDGTPPTNWRAIFGGSAWTWCEERQQYYLHTFASQQPDLNWENPEVRRALYDAANFWVDKGVGGFRVDAIVYIKKPAEFIDGKPDGKDGLINIHNMTANTPGILEFLREFKREVFDGHDIFTVGEANGVKPEELSQWVGDYGVFDMLFEFSHTNLALNESEIWCEPVKWKLTDLKRAISRSQDATKYNGWYPVFFENHDRPRSINYYFYEGADKKKAAKALAAILLTMRGTPFIYQGEELGMSNINWDNINIYDDISSKAQYNFALNEGFTPDEAMKFVKFFSRDNARTPMQWNNKTSAGFSSNSKTWLPVNENYLTINAENEINDSDSVLNWYKNLLAFRNKNNILIMGDYQEILSDSEEIFAFERSLDNEKIITLVNFSANPVKIPDIAGSRKIIFCSENDPEPDKLKPLEARIYQ
ncbi:MAG: hypothetical protein IJS99_02055, partial [Synergistaceae bacterium]|nr:hypothetical protein [Synergistaceae bacterium]